MFKTEKRAVILCMIAVSLGSILAPSCAPLPTPTPCPSPPTVKLVANPPIKDGQVAPRQTEAFTLETSGSNLKYKWSVSRGKLSASDEPSVIYTAPDSPGVDTVTVEVTSASGATTQSVCFSVRTPPTMIFTIAAPYDKVVCPMDGFCTFPVFGAISGTAPDPNWKIVVFVNNAPRQSDKWWPHQQVSIIRKDGAWQSQAQMGDVPCTGANDDFQIVALLMTAEQASRVVYGWQVLPQAYIAQSNIVDLVTTYAPLPVDLSFAYPNTDKGSRVDSFSTSINSLEINYDLGTGNWVSVIVPLIQNLFCMKELDAAVVFSLEGIGAANAMEVKLEDTDSTNYGWLSGPGVSVTAKKTIKVPLSDLKYWYSGNPEMNWKQARNIVLAIVKRPGTAGPGKVIIRDIAITP